MASLTSLYEAVLSVSRTSPSVLSALLHCSSFVESLAVSIGSGFEPAVTVQLMELSQLVFPLCASLQGEFVDAGVCICLNDLLRCEAPVALAAASLTRVLSETSEYARNALVCMGVHETLIELAKERLSGEMTIACCQCLLAIFKMGGEIESEYLIASARQMLPLMEIDAPAVVSLVVRCFVEMSNAHNGFSDIVFVFYELGLFPVAVGLLDNPQVVAAAIRLVGNLCVAEPVQIRSMLDVGLMEKVLHLLDSEYAADAFWVMSNLLEKMQSEVLALVNEPFVQRVMDVIESSSYDIQKEASFFLATVILFSSASALGPYLQVCEPLVQMLECGDEKIEFRCLETLIKLCKHAIVMTDLESRNRFAALLLESDVKSRLENIVEANKFVEQASIFERLYGILVDGLY